MKFKEIRFGYASAEAEGTSDPELLIKGYFDPANLIPQVLGPDRFLFLGPKGSGKSSIARHLVLSKSDPNLFVTPIYLADFPYRDLPAFTTVSNSSEKKYPEFWGCLMLLLILESFSHDNGGTHVDSGQFISAIRVLRDAGFLPHGEFAGVLENTKKLAMKLSAIPGFEASYESSGADMSSRPHNIPFLLQKLRTLVAGFRSESKHVVIIDGLDDALSFGNPVLEPLSALMRETDRLNIRFKTSAIPAKIVVLCRTELFDRLPGSNNNKLRQDSAVQIDWYRTPRDPDSVWLVALANLRASMDTSQPINLFTSAFPPVIGYTSPTQFLLELTRHTPRDFLQLLKHIQYFAGDSTRLSEEQIFSGTSSYQRDYFLPEIMDELDGYFERRLIEDVFQLFRRLRKRRFVFDELLKLCESTYTVEKRSLIDILQAMFDCSALGNWTEARTTHGPSLRYTFRYRNRGSEINLDEGMVLHRGLWRALNL